RKTTWAATTSASAPTRRAHPGAVPARPSRRPGSWTARRSWRSFQRDQVDARSLDHDEMAVGDLLPAGVVVVWFAGQHHAVVSTQYRQSVAPRGGAQLRSVGRQDVPPCVGIGSRNFDDGVAERV